MKWEETECGACHNTGYVEYVEYQTVTHDMAIDAGNPESEGQEVVWGIERQSCTDCNTLVESISGVLSNPKCPKCGAKDMDIEWVCIPNIYGGTLFYECHICETSFHRWPKTTDHNFRDKAEPYMNLIKAKP